MRNPSIWIGIAGSTAVALQVGQVLWYLIYAAPTVHKGLVGLLRFLYLFLIPQMFFSVVTFPFLVWLAMLALETAARRLRSKRPRAAA